MDRREFVKLAGAAAGGAAAVSLPHRRLAALAAPSLRRPTLDPAIKELALLALDAAKSAGASYADVRIGRVQTESIQTRDDHIAGLSSEETFGFGVRALAGGAWGFAASRLVERDEVVRVARRAAAQAKANARYVRVPVRLAPVDAYPDVEWHTPVEIDPWSISLEEKVDLLLKANAEAMRVAGVRVVTSSLFFHREEKTVATTDGTLVFQTLVRSSPQVSVTAVGRGEFQTRQSAEVPPAARGYEHVLGARLVENAGRWAEEAVQKLTAKPVEPGLYTLVLDPSHLWLTIHESIGHPTELDRALGYEANYAGTSFLAPPDGVLGRLRYGPELMNVQADRTQAGALASTGWDDEGVPADRWLLIKDGVFADYQTTREQVAWIAHLTGVQRSHGCSYAQSWRHIPFQRMPNVSLLPGAEDITLEDIIADTDAGIYIVGDGSYSIDQQRYNFQFGGQVFYEIEDGRIAGMLKDVAYQARTVDFWNSMDRIGGPRSYFVGGSMFDGKGQPGQINAVSHGCVPARFRNVTVLNTGRGER
ncbi:MAG: TldD/PmbA family protein [Gemmatimonadetes bacterium]|nr:TldD/PmbA family protein [Gemmatimonadota bacterium]